MRSMLFVIDITKCLIVLILTLMQAIMCNMKYPRTPSYLYVQLHYEL